MLGGCGLVVVGCGAPVVGGCGLVAIGFGTPSVDGGCGLAAVWGSSVVVLVVDGTEVVGVTISVTSFEC